MPPTGIQDGPGDKSKAHLVYTEGGVGWDADSPSQVEPGISPPLEFPHLGH